MELSGEVIAGQFFAGLATPQFITPRSFTALQTNQTQRQHFWVSAVDPVAPTGLSLDWSDLPQRRYGNYLTFHNADLALVVYNFGRELSYFVDHNHAAMDDINAVLEFLVYQRRHKVIIQEINGVSAKESPYLGPLDRLFRVGHDHKAVFLEAKF